jgi:hypothetical protein
MMNENRPSAKIRSSELVTGERLLQMTMASIRKSQEEKEADFERRVLRKTIWLINHDPYALPDYLANPY